MFGSGMAAPGAGGRQGVDPDAARFAVWYDVLGIDSDYDYDPVWQKCRELGIAPTFHSRRPQLRRCATRRPTSPSTISATSPPPAMRSPRRCSSAA